MTHNNQAMQSDLQAFIWPLSLAIGSIFGSWALACLFPFAAFAAMAALTMSKRQAIGLIITVWAANQAVGFFVLSFPWDGQAVGHGISLLVATLAGYGAARFAASFWANPFLRSIAALASAFIVYEVILRVYASFGGGAENFSAEIIGQVARNDILWFAGLMALRWALSPIVNEKPLLASA